MRGANLMKILTENPQNTSPSPPSPQDILEAIWDRFPGGRFEDTTPRARASDPAHQARFQRLVLSIHRQLTQIKKARPRITPMRRVMRARTRRSPASQRRATADSGGSDSDGGGDPEPRSRRQRQAGALYEDAPSVLEYPGLRAYLEKHNANLNLAVQADGRAGLHPNGTDCVLWPIHHPRDVFSGAIIGVVCDAPSENLEVRGKQFINKRSGGLCFGSLHGARTIYITSRPSHALAIAGATGRPCLSLFTARGLTGISEATARELGERGLQAVVVANETESREANECAQQIRLATPQVKVKVSTYKEWNDDLLDELTESTFTHAPPSPARRDTHDDFLACPDLSGGPLGPEPPPLDAPLTKNNVTPIVPWRPRADAPKRPTLPTLKDMQSQLVAVLPEAIEAARSGRPVLISTPPGGGKTYQTLKAILDYKITEKTEDGEEVTRPLTFIAASSTKDLATSAYETAKEAGVGRMRLWDGRQVQGLCDESITTKHLMDRGRSPQRHACQNCERGKKPDPGKEDTRCLFQKNLSDAPGDRGIFGQHGILGKESTLFKVARGGKNAERDLLWIDEGFSTFSTIEVSSDDIAAARHAATRIEDHILELRQKAFKKTRKGKENDDKFTEDDFTEAREWAKQIEPQLRELATLLTGARGEGLYEIDPFLWRELISLGSKIPKAALSLDGTALEKVDNVWGQKPTIPLAWIQPFISALGRTTAWIRVSKTGIATLLGTNPTDLWDRYLKKGGILTDASSTHIDEIRAAGGLIIDLQCEQPNLKIIQYGPRLHGRGDGGTTKKGRARMEEEVAGLLGVLGDDEDAGAITHATQAKLMKGDERVRHWGVHKGHNDWKKKKRLVLWGLPLPSAPDQIVGYKTFRAGMKAQGIHLPDWNGGRAREWVRTDDWEIMPAAGLPDVPEARDWLLREVAANVFQAIGRLRAVRATEPVTVEIYGLLPIFGFGMRIDEMRLESQGRLANKTKARAIIAAGVADLGEARTRVKLQEYFKKHAGRGISKNEADALVADLKIQAIESGVTLHEAARASCAACTRLLEAGHEPQAIAQAARASQPGVIKIAVLLDQLKRSRAPGLQRAGP